MASSRAHWGLGAHYLAACRNDDAIGAFAAAVEKAQQAKENADEHLSSAYIGVTMTVTGRKPDGRKAIDDAIKELSKLTDGQFFVSQVETALRVFLKV